MGVAKRARHFRRKGAELLKLHNQAQVAGVNVKLRYKSRILRILRYTIVPAAFVAGLLLGVRCG